MPVRIYDISKKLGLENKEVLAKAKALGIAAARVASSSLDKITAEYLEQQIVLTRRSPKNSRWHACAFAKIKFPRVRANQLWRIMRQRDHRDAAVAVDLL